MSACEGSDFFTNGMLILRIYTFRLLWFMIQVHFKAVNNVEKYYSDNPGSISANITPAFGK
jgi:hypothetical protein